MKILENNPALLELIEKMEPKLLNENIVWEIPQSTLEKLIGETENGETKIEIPRTSYWAEISENVGATAAADNVQG